MIRLVEALNYRCLRYVRQELGQFHVLVGPNGSGKSTFLDAVRFIADFVQSDLWGAINSRSLFPPELFWRREADRFELAVEIEIPDELRRLVDQDDFRTVRYELAVKIDLDRRDVSIVAERVILNRMLSNARYGTKADLSGQKGPVPTTLRRRVLARTSRVVIDKDPARGDRFTGERDRRKSYTFKIGPLRSALRNLPEDETQFPVCTWLKTVLGALVSRVILSPTSLQWPSPLIRPQGTLFNGAYLPWDIELLLKDHPELFQDWIDHVKTALPDLETVRTLERPEDRSRHLVVSYRGGLDLASWTVSEGTLRLLALTILAYVPGLKGVWMIEEPENGIHPKGVETVFQSLSSVYDAQILMATHSPLILNLADPSQILCFRKGEDGETQILNGNEHPALRYWKKEESLGVLFAAGVLE